MSQNVEYLEDILQSLDQYIVVIDRDERVVIWNPPMEAHFLPQKQALGQWLRKIFPQFWEEFRGKIWGDILVNDVMLKGNTEELYRFPLKTSNNKICHFDLKGTPLKNSRDGIMGAILLMNDVTDRIQLEEQQLRHARTTSLANLGASVAHEIRNPLNSISLNIQLIKEWTESPEGCPREQTLEILDNVLMEIKRLNDRIRYFLTFSRLPTPHRVPENPNLAVEQALKLLAEDARHAHVEIIKNLGKLPPILIDLNQLSQAVYNICLNAIQEMRGQGGGKLEVTSLVNKDYVLLEVKDNGRGFEETAKSNLFQLFYTTKEDGSGLGLPIANQIVDQHEGRIVAENNLDRGACFSIYLPVYPDSLRDVQEIQNCHKGGTEQ